MPPSLRLMVEPHVGGGYAQFLRLARAAEDAGYDAFFRSDHLYYAAGDAPRPALEAWTTLAALARETTRIRLGTLVTPMTFRHPSVLAREVATVDELSGGRVEIGVGTGWYEVEHTTLGIDFPSQRERTEHLEEAVEVMRLLWSGEVVSYSGRHYRLDRARALPRPIQDPLPLVLGGHGGPRSVALAARHADEYNTTSIDPPGAAQTYARARQACAQVDRDPATLRLSWMGTVLVAPDQDALRRRAAQVAAWTGAPGDDPDHLLAQLAERGIVGFYEQAAARLRDYVDAGAQCIYARIWDLDDLDQISEIRERLLPLC
jgi:F420-dependent oxidoreductase-like protein